MDNAAALAVEGKVLGKGLADDHVNGQAGQDSNSGRILVKPVAKSLVGDVDERHMALGPHLLAEGSPLLGREVMTGRVVAAALEKEDAPAWRTSYGFQTGLKVDLVILRVLIVILYRFQSGELEKRLRVAPVG